MDYTLYLVLKVSDGDTLLLKLVVGPGDDLALDNGRVVRVELGQQGQGVGPHQLPDQGQGQGPVTLHDVRALRKKISTILKKSLEKDFFTFSVSIFTYND